MALTMPIILIFNNAKLLQRQTKLY